MIICWICPDPEAFVSGGNLYNRRLIQALQQAGWTCRQLDWQAFSSGNFPTADLYLFDSLYFKNIKSIDNPIRQGKQGLICHYLPELENPDSDLSALQSFDLLICPSVYLQKRLQHYLGSTLPECWVIPPILELFSVENIEPLSPPLILKVANLVEEKGVLPFLQELNQHLKQFSEISDFQLEIYGSSYLNPAYAQACRQFLAKEPALQQRIRLGESLPPRKLMRRYRQATILVSASRFETFGMAVAEAIALQLPVFALAVGNLPYLIDHPTKGQLFDDLSTLCNSMLRQLQEPAAPFQANWPTEFPFSSEKAIELWQRNWHQSSLF